MNANKARICYFGIYKAVAPRDKVYLDGVKKLGFSVVECVDNSAGFSKFFRLAKKHRVLENSYDILWVGYLSTILVSLARLVSRKKIVFNALSSWYENTVLDRESYARFSPKAIFIWFSDFLAFHLAHLVLIESEQQKIFIAKKFFVNPAKLAVVFTGVDEGIFHPDASVKKADTFTAVFRGLFLPATGVEYVIESARLLKDEAIKFRIIGWGEPLQSKLQKIISEEKLLNVNLTTVFLEPEELRKTMLSAHCMLGQFAAHERMNRTIQNKNFEALALGMPLITRDSLSNREILTDGNNCLFVPAADAPAIAEAIRRLKRERELAQTLGKNARNLFESHLNEAVLARRLAEVLGELD